VDADRAGPLLRGAYRDLGAEAGAGTGDDDGPPLEAARYGNGCCGHGRVLPEWVRPQPKGGPGRGSWTGVRQVGYGIQKATFIIREL
jgi:hypothetical protein